MKKSANLVKKISKKDWTEISKAERNQLKDFIQQPEDIRDVNQECKKS